LKGNKEKKILIVGVGNLYRGDDAIGILMARYFRKFFKDSVKIIGVDATFEDLICDWKNFDVVILIDAIMGDDAGKIYRFEYGIDKIPAVLKFYSTHSFGVAEYIELAEALGTLPKKLIIYGIVGNKFDIGDSISHRVKLSCKNLVGLVLEDLNSGKFLF